MVKYATAIKNGTASTEAVLSRFTGAASHPAYQAMLEVGKAQRTLFVARYLFDRDLQRQIEQGLNVVESWNRANAIICYGKSGEISTNHREEVEMTALCLRILQASLVFVFSELFSRGLTAVPFGRVGRVAGLRRAGVFASLQRISQSVSDQLLVDAEPVHLRQPA